MAPVLHLVRHAQGYHNLGAEFHSLTDPKLTALGEEQCALLKTKFFPDQSKISLITASPLTRTIHTAYATFSPALTNDQCRAQIVALPDAQETSDFPCDTGSDIPVLTKKCADEGWPVDLARLNDGWNIKTSDSRYSPSGTAIRERARATRQQIRELAKELVAAGNPDPEIVLVTHGAFLHYFTEDWEDSDKYLGTGWLNTETRAYNFEAGIDSADHDAHIIETNASRARRGKASPAFPRAEQEKMYHTSMQGWENQGLQNPTKLDPAHAVAAGVQADEIKVTA